MQVVSDEVGQAQRALVVGLGDTGLSAACWLAARGIAVAVTDSRERPPRLADLRTRAPDAALFLGGFPSAALERADFVVLSPGVPRDEEIVRAAIAAGLPVVGDIELFARTAHAPVVAVTGSNGKSTVATLVAAIATRAGRRTAAGGNLGTPALDLLTDPEPELYVLELSSFQLESTESLRPAASAVLNLSEDHLDRYPDVAAYGTAKGRIFKGAGISVFNREDPAVVALVPDEGDSVSFGLDAPGPGDYGLREVEGRDWLCRGDEPIMAAAELAMIGRHNTANALAALALAEAVALPRDAAVAVLREFGGLPHRTEFVAERGGARWINDSKGTNVGATLAAVQGIAGELVVILGGDGKGQDFAPLVPVLAARARAVVVLGKDRARIAAVLAGAVAVHEVDDMAQAVRTAAGLAQAGDTVLLSPACSSLDMFSGFDARGRAFAEAVRGLE